MTFKACFRATTHQGTPLCVRRTRQQNTIANPSMNTTTARKHGRNCGCYLAALRELFLQHLPSNVWMVLTPSAADLSLNQLTQLTDHIVEALPTPTISTTVAHTAYTHSQLTAQVMELTIHLTSQMSSTVNNLFKRQARSPSPGRWVMSFYFYGRCRNVIYTTGLILFIV